MKPSDITVGKTYVNRGKGRTRRTVLEISDKLKPFWYGPGSGLGGGLVVRYRQGDREDNLYLSSFAAWCGREVSDE